MSLRYGFAGLLIWSVSHDGFGHGGLIKGSVSDSTSNTVLAGVSVLLGNDQAITSTDQLGNFKFDDLRSGTYRIRFSHIGYASRELTVNVGENETVILRIYLTPASLNLEEVTISDHTSTEAMMTNISRIDVALRPVKSSQDILRMVPGLITSQHAGGGKAEQIFLRGFDIDHGTDIALTVDGMPVNMVSHAHGQGYADLHFLIPEIIDHVNFNKGPYYASVGDFNTAGYANFQTRNSLRGSSVKLEAGSFDTYRAVGLFDLLSNKGTNQNAYLAAEYLYTNGPFISPQNFNRINLFGKYSGRIGEDKMFTVSLSTFKSEWDASGQIPERAVTRGLIDRFGAIDDTEGGFTGRSNANFTIAKFNDDGSIFRNQFFVSHYDFELYSNFTYFLNDPVNGDAIKQKESRVIYGYQGVYNRDLVFGSKSIHSEFGVGFRYDDIKNNELSHVKARYTFLNSMALGDIDQLNASGYADLKFDITPRVMVNAGIRFDAFSFQYADKLSPMYERQTETANVVSPKLGVYYNPGQNLQFYVKSGFGFHSNDTRVVVAQRGQKILPKALGTDVGLFAKPFRNVLMNFAVWQLDLEQEFVYVGDEAVVEAGGKTRRRGVDLSLRYQALNWLFVDFDGNYAHARSVDDLEGQNYIPLAPAWTSGAGLTATWRNGIHAGVRYRHVANRPANEENTVTAKGYFLLDAAISYARPGFELSLSITNIFDRDWNEAQFDTETLIPGDSESISELTFTPGDPLLMKAGIRFFF